jgi:hypothetical protein
MNRGSGSARAPGPPLQLDLQDGAGSDDDGGPPSEMSRATPA